MSFFISTLFQLQVFEFVFNRLIQVPKTPCNWPILDTKIPRFLGQKFGVVPWTSIQEQFLFVKSFLIPLFTNFRGATEVAAGSNSSFLEQNFIGYQLRQSFIDFVSLYCKIPSLQLGLLRMDVLLKHVMVQSNKRALGLATIFTFVLLVVLYTVSPECECECEI